MAARDSFSVRQPRDYRHGLPRRPRWLTELETDMVNERLIWARARPKPAPRLSPQNLSPHHVSP
jgi:hypothetical protein